MLEDRSRKLSHWTKKWNEVLDLNFKATYLQGRKVKNFYHLLKKGESVSAEFLAINDDPSLHGKIRNKMKDQGDL